jgi:hypothetical protein
VITSRRAEDDTAGEIIPLLVVYNESAPAAYTVKDLFIVVVGMGIGAVSRSNGGCSDPEIRTAHSPGGYQMFYLPFMRFLEEVSLNIFFLEIDHTRVSS